MIIANGKVGVCRGRAFKYKIRCVSFTIMTQQFYLSAFLMIRDVFHEQRWEKTHLRWPRWKSTFLRVCNPFHKLIDNQSLLNLPASSTVENLLEACGVSWVVDSVFPRPWLSVLLKLLNCQLNIGKVFQESRNSFLPIPWNRNMNRPWNDDVITNAYVTNWLVVNVEIPARSQQKPSTTESETAARRLARMLFSLRWETWIISRMIILKNMMLINTIRRTGARKLTKNAIDFIQHLKRK